MRSTKTLVVTCAAMAAIASGLLVHSTQVESLAKHPPVPRLIAGKSPGAPPSDAVLLIGDDGLSKWQSAKTKGAAKWDFEDGVATVNGTGDIITKEKFGDCQLHMEWRIPKEAGNNEGKGNSGVKLHTRYEVQILNSYPQSKNPIQQAGAIYVQHPPLVNVCRKAGEWQTYDIVFRAPRFDENGEVREKGTLTVFHNGVLIQDHAEIQGPTNSKRKASPHYKKPLLLQDHGARVSFRNVWVRPLTDREE